MPVYFIQDEGGEIKIGYSDGNPYRRLNTFRTGNPRELKLLVSIPGGAAQEKDLHDRFKELRGRGEWFRPDSRLLCFIEAMQYAYRDQQPEQVADTCEDTVAGLSIEQLETIRGFLKAREVHEQIEAFDRVSTGIRSQDEVSPHIANRAYELEGEIWDIRQAELPQAEREGIEFYFAIGIPEHLPGYRDADDFITSAKSLLNRICRLHMGLDCNDTEATH